MLKFVHLKYFVASVEAGSITTAARNLFISQPALSKQLGQLEAELNCELFLRKTTGIELTEAGKHFYQKASAILRSADELTLEMDRFTNEQTIRIGALPSLSAHFLPGIVNILRRNYKIEVLIKDTTEELIGMLKNNQADFICVQDAPSSKNFIVENIFWEPYDAILTASLGKKYSDVSLAEFVQEPLILHKHPCDIRSYFEDYCKRNKINYEMAMELETNESIVAFVSKGLGLSLMPRMVSQNIKDESVLIKTFVEENFGRTIDLLYKSTSKKLAKPISAIFKENIPFKPLL